VDAADVRADGVHRDGQRAAAILAAGGLTVVAVDRNEHALGDLPDNVRREVADTTDPPVAPRLIDRIAGEVGPRRAG
jgi:NAD(P)-dependent dehydrogenase (short-subunit alcohol dehydrogenase family)